MSETNDRSTNILKRLAGFVLIVLGLAGLAVSAVGVGGAWWARPKLNAKVADVGGRVDKILEVTVASLRQGENILAQTRQELDELHKAAQDGPPPEFKPQGMKKFLIDKLARQFTPQLEQSRRIVDAAVNGAAVVNSILDGLEDLPLAKFGRLDVDKINALSGKVESASASALQLSAFLNTLPGDPASSAEAAQQTAALKETLEQVENEVKALTTRVSDTRDQITQVRNEVPGWITLAALTITLFLVWFALGQLCLVKRGWSWLRGTSS